VLPSGESDSERPDGLDVLLILNMAGQAHVVRRDDDAKRSSVAATNAARQLIAA